MVRVTGDLHERSFPMSGMGHVQHLQRQWLARGHLGQSQFRLIDDANLHDHAELLAHSMSAVHAANWAGSMA